MKKNECMVDLGALNCCVDAMNDELRYSRPTPYGTHFSASTHRWSVPIVGLMSTLTSTTEQTDMIP